MAKNIKMNKKKLGLIGGIVLVNTLLASIFSLGGHVPFKLDDTKKYLITEKHEVNGDITTNSYYGNSFKKNYTIHYGKPFLYENKIIRAVSTRNDDQKNGFYEETFYVPCDNLDEEEYVETVTYNKDLDSYIIVKESLKDEVLSDIILVSSMAFSSTILYTIGKSVIEREEEKRLIKE